MRGARYPAQPKTGRILVSLSQPTSIRYFQQGGQNQKRQDQISVPNHHRLARLPGAQAAMDRHESLEAPSDVPDKNETVNSS